MCTVLLPSGVNPIAVHIYRIISYQRRGPGSSVGTATDYGLDGPGSNPAGDNIFRPPDRSWSPASLLYRERPGAHCTHPHLVPKILEKNRAIPLLNLRACAAYKKGRKPTISKTSRKLHWYNGQSPRWKVRGSKPGKENFFLSSPIQSKPVQGLTKPPRSMDVGVPSWRKVAFVILTAASIQCRVYEWMELHPCSPYMPLLRGKHYVLQMSCK